jgi:hypothetical protein
VVWTLGVAAGVDTSRRRAVLGDGNHDVTVYLVQAVIELPGKPFRVKHITPVTL